MLKVFERIIKEVESIDHHNHREDALSMRIDKFRRHDHGGGPDREDWLPEHEVDKDYQAGEEKHKDKINAVNKILEEEGYEPNAEFYLSEKGNFSIQIFHLEKLNQQ